MGSNAFENELLRDISLLNSEQQAKVLTFVRSLLQNIASGADTKGILRFAGVFDAESLKEMSAAIKADCEKIDKDGW